MVVYEQCVKSLKIAELEVFNADKGDFRTE